MRSPVFIGITILVSAVILTLFGISAMGPLEPKKEAANLSTNVTPLETPTVVFGNPIKGRMEARVTIVEFGDFLCEPCAAMDEILTALLAEFPDDLRIVWKDFPIVEDHDEALNSAVAARCSGLQGKFWEYHDMLLANQDSINAGAYAIFGERIGLDLQEFKQCVEDARTKPIVERDFEEGQRLRIDGVPYLFINGRRVSGVIDIESLRTLVTSALISASQTK